MAKLTAKISKASFLFDREVLKFVVTLRKSLLLDT